MLKMECIPSKIGNIVLEGLCNKARKGNKWHIHWEGRNKTVLIYTRHGQLCRSQGIYKKTS